LSSPFKIDAVQLRLLHCKFIHWGEAISHGGLNIVRSSVGLSNVLLSLVTKYSVGWYVLDSLKCRRPLPPLAIMFVIVYTCRASRGLRTIYAEHRN